MYCCPCSHSRPSDPELNPPHFSCLQVSVTLQYVAQCYGLHHSSLVATLSKTKVRGRGFPFITANESVEGTSPDSKVVM